MTHVELEKHKQRKTQTTQWDQKSTQNNTHSAPKAHVKTQNRNTSMNQQPQQRAQENDLTR